MKLSRKILIYFIFIILISLLIVSLTYRFMINKTFFNYLREQDLEKRLRIAQEINQVYEESSYKILPKDLNYYANLEGLEIAITDLNKNILSLSKARSHGHMSHSKSHSQRKLESQGLREELLKAYYPLMEGDEKVGYILIAYEDKSYLNENAEIFLKTLNPSLIIAGAITCLVGFFLSSLMARSLSKPILKITSLASEMETGILRPKDRVETKISEIKELYNSIDQLGLSLSRQEEIRRAYASDISHELRTPLATIKSYLEAIIDGVLPPSKNLEILLEEVDRLTKLVEDLEKSFSSQDYKPRIRPRVFNLSLELENMVKAYSPIFEKEGHRLSYEIQDKLYTKMDLDRFKQVISNSLSNSLKALGPRGRVHIGLRRDQDYLILNIVDNGIGIKKEDLSKVFYRFYRSDLSRTRDTGGSGIGLSIVKNFIEEAQGQVAITSSYGHYTKLEIRLRPYEKSQLPN